MIKLGLLLEEGGSFVAALDTVFHIDSITAQ